MPTYASEYKQNWSHDTRQVGMVLERMTYAVKSLQSHCIHMMCDWSRVFSEFRLYGIPYVFLNTVYSV